MAESASEARIRDLKRRLELDPTSRLFVSLAEEYRKAGRVSDALITLQQGLRNHPGYVSAHVALGRAYIESGNISEAIATFTKVLATDPGNLVSAKSLADIYLSRGESVESVKKYKLYRALSGDRTVDEIIARLERELAPPAPKAPRVSATAPLPAPPTFHEPAMPTPRPSRAIELPESGSRPLAPKDEIFEVTSIKWEDSTAGGKKRAAPEPGPAQPPAVVAAPAPAPEPPPLPPAAPKPPPPEPAEPFAPFTDDAEAAEPSAPTTSLDELFAEEAEAPFVTGLPSPTPPASDAERPTDRLEGAAAAPPPPAEAEASEPQGRTLADLYFAQGHYREALKIYDELVVAYPVDAELKRLRRDAEARLLPAGGGAVAPADAALQRRLARIRVLKQWLSVVQAG